MNLREKYFQAVRASQRGEKTLVSKSAVGPHVVPVRNQHGEILGFGRPERIPSDELGRIIDKEDTSKCSDGLGGGVGPNPENDCLSMFFPEVQPIGQVVQKSTDEIEDEYCPKELQSIFPAAFK